MPRRDVALIFALLVPCFSHALVNGVDLKGATDVVRIRFSNGSVCSGVFVDPFTILTAAHCTLTEKGESRIVSKIETENDHAVDVNATASMANPLYARQMWPAYDVGVIKTTKNKSFTGEFKLAKANESVRGEATFYGCGRINEKPDKIYSRTTGTNAFTRVGSVLIVIGKTLGENPSTGENVSVAHSDSGGTITDTHSGKIIAVMTTTTVWESARWHLPTLATGTSVTSESNRDFILKNLGQR